MRESYAVKENSYEVLQGAIIGQAFIDYRDWYLHDNPMIKEVQNYLEKFPNGEYMMQKIRKEVDSCDRVKLNLSLYLRNKKKIKRLKKCDYVNLSKSQCLELIPQLEKENVEYLKEFNRKIKKLDDKYADILVKKYIKGVAISNQQKTNKNVREEYDKAVRLYGVIK